MTPELALGVPGAGTRAVPARLRSPSSPPPCAGVGAAPPWRRLLSWLALLLLAAWLAGCASTGAPAGDAPDKAPATATRSAPPAPVSIDDVETGDSSRYSVTPSATAAPANVWDRIRRGFAMPDLDTGLVREREGWYSARPEQLERMTERSRMYIFHIVEELERRRMPTELALLPFVESAFDPKAVSSAKAAGMWQFMPATGKHFDLTQNMFRDDRRDILQSTRAALDYLQKLHDMFGDWHLALAAYNWGEGNVGRALMRARASGGATDYASLRMPNETRHYVPKLQALKNIIARPDAFGVRLPDIGNHPYFDTVRLDNDMDVAVAAELAEIGVEDFRALNPSLNRPVIFAAGTPHILLPWDSAAVFKRNLARRPKTRLASWTAWVAPTTMPAREVARQTNMDEDTLRQINRIPPNMVVKAGSTLLVQRGENARGNVSGHVADQARIAFTPEIVLRPLQVRARRGDTIARVAARYDLPPATVAGWNDASADTPLKRGQAVTLMLPTRAGSQPVLPRARPDPRPEPRAARRAAARDDDDNDRPRARAGARSKRDAAPAKGKGKTRARDDDDDDRPTTRATRKAKATEKDRADDRRSKRAGRASARRDDDDDDRPSARAKAGSRAAKAERPSEKTARGHKPARAEKAERAEKPAKSDKAPKAAKAHAGGPKKKDKR